MKLLRKLKNLSNRIPRPLKACVCAVLAIALAIAYYIALGCPTLSFQKEFRRAEKAHLVGPSKIVDQLLMPEYDEFDKMIVAQTDEGICFFGRYYSNYPYDDPFADKLYYFNYVEKTGSMTLAAAPNVWGMHWTFHQHKRSVPVYLFTDETDAIRAEVRVTVPEPDNDHGNTHTFLVKSDWSESGVFRFWFEADDTSDLSALYFLSQATGGSAYDPLFDKELAMVITATVQLYDGSDNLILEEDMEIHPQP